MKPHKRNGRVAKQQRQQDANARHMKVEQEHGYRNGALDNLPTGTKVRKAKKPGKAKADG